MGRAEETMEGLWAYCTSNKRLVPQPPEWAKLHGMLKDARQLPSGGWEPAAPLILAAWNTTMPIEKQLRFQKHIEWARDHGQLDEIGRFLRALPESRWVHFGEI